ncbi:hypothetical protein AB0M46_47145 [Dactylosporangium sp. NPDC051485]|uniref:hypothetical protein n=1 Tax=Dactylosporangium sp. NPDC051485 TaxID=3154846 RepID=UPI00342CB615
MSAAEVIVALYPPAVRERWGAEIGREVAERGARSWTDAVAGAVRLWLHPGDWPETAAGQTRRVLAVALFAVTAAATLLLRAAEPAPYPHATALWLALLAVGALLAAPLPPLRWRALRILCAEAVGTMAAPGVAVVAMVALANSGLVERPTAAIGVVLVAYYWSTLAFAALRACTLVARVQRISVVPTARRLRGALLLVGAGTALAAGQGTLSALHTGVGNLCVTAALGLLAGLTLQTGQNLPARRP